MLLETMAFLLLVLAADQGKHSRLFPEALTVLALSLHERSSGPHKCFPDTDARG